MEKNTTKSFGDVKFWNVFVMDGINKMFYLFKEQFFIRKIN
jgi:hypothetical protein